MQKNIYDVIIVGSGVSGVFAAVALIKKDNNLKILMLDKGRPLPERSCPMKAQRKTACLNCKVCNKLFGFAGLGKSEGKFNISSQFGGNLAEKIGVNEAFIYLKKVDELLKSFGAAKAFAYSTFNPDFKGLCESLGAEAQFSDVLHLGSETSLLVFTEIYDFLKTKITIVTDTEITDISKENFFCVRSRNQAFFGNRVILASGTNNQSVTSSLCKSLGITAEKTRVDIGVRVETDMADFKELLTHVSEFKLRYPASQDGAYTYCMNPYGYIIKKHQFGFTFADGQNYRERDKKSDRINFTVFVPHWEETVSESQSYVNKTVARINSTDERIIAEKLCDLRGGKATDFRDLTPTLEAEAADFRDYFDTAFTEKLLGIIAVIEKLLHKSLDDALLYAPDIKEYAPLIKTDPSFMTDVDGLYCVGACTGETWSLSHAAASGLYVGERVRFD